MAAGLDEYSVTPGFGLIKIFYGNPKLHYEANHQPSSQTVEIGLHFEAERLTNAQLLGAFRIREKKVRRELPGARLEVWDKGWSRIWEPLPYQQLDAAFQRAVAERLARYITVLEPILRDELPADVPWTLPRKPARKGTGTTASRARKLIATRKAIGRPKPRGG